MGMFDWLTGNIDNRATAANVNTKAGTAALQSRAQMLGQQNQAQQYSLAASGGGFSPLAIREAQRRSMAGQAQLGQQALQEQRMLEQQAATQNAQNQMQAQQMNIDIAKHNAGGVMRGVGTAAGTAAMVFASDIRAKEDVHPYQMLSDFVAKEPVPVGSYIPQQARPGAPASAFSHPEVQRALNERREAAFDREQLMMAQAADQGPGAVQQLGVSPEQAHQAQMLRDSNQAIAGAAQGSPAYGPAAGFQQPGQPQQDPGAIQKLLGFLQQRGDGGGTMASDYISKEPAFYARGGSSPEQQAQPDLATAAMQRFEAERNVRPGNDWLSAMREQARREDEEKLRQFFSGRDQPVGITADNFRAPMSPEQAHQALAPIDPVEYRYRKEAAARMAMEQGAASGEAPMVYADKRAPRPGIIAQQLEQSPAFAPAVVNTPAGKAVVQDRATSVNLAATAGLEKRQTAMEDEVARLKRLLGEGEQRALQNIEQAGQRPKARGGR